MMLDEFRYWIESNVSVCGVVLLYVAVILSWIAWKIHKDQV